MMRILLAFRDNIQGSFAIFLALSAVPIILMMGIGIDFYTELSYKTRLDAAADAATVAAAQTAQQYIASNAASQDATTLLNNAIAVGKSQAAKVFWANAGTAAPVTGVTPAFTISKNGTQLVATASYSGSVKLGFSPMVGFSQGPITGKASASLGFATYVNYYVLLDTSGSMGIGSTAADMSRLYSLTAGTTDGGSCVFACHGHYYSSDTTPDHEWVAHNAIPSVTLRIDSAKTAIENMISQAKHTIGNTGNIQIGIWTMELNGTPGTYIQKLADLSSNYDSLISAAENIDLPLFINNNSNVPGWSDMKDAVSALTAIIPANGTGLSAASPINYAFIVTDGVQDTIGPCDSNGHCTGPIDLTSCAALQKKANVATIYTTYLPIYNGNNAAAGFDSFYSSEVAQPVPDPGVNMQKCASNSSLYFKADDGPALIAAMQKLFTATNQPVALSQ